VGSEINFAMSSCNKATQVSMTTPMQSVLEFSDHRLLTLFGGREAEYSGTGQSLDNVFIVDFIVGHPRRVVVARILVPEGVACHQGCTLLFMKLKATCSALSPASLKALIFCSSSGS
jgi:hypothetical protein